MEDFEAGARNRRTERQHPWEQRVVPDPLVAVVLVRERGAVANSLRLGDVP